MAVIDRIRLIKAAGRIVIGRNYHRATTARCSLNAVAKILRSEVTEAVSGRILITARPNSAQLNPFWRGAPGALPPRCSTAVVLSPGRRIGGSQKTDHRPTRG